MRDTLDEEARSELVLNKEASYNRKHKSYLILNVFLAEQKRGDNSKAKQKRQVAIESINLI